MENFVVSARKYRPSTFDTVVGQHAITSTLKNAIKSNHLAQAFLFCGPRGVGKTTCARILAKTINCFSITENIEACDECDSCRAFNENHSLNIVELDGASNNSVEDIRSLIDQVRFAPQLGSYKIYIIDEVHMLSQAAFNAFLKTLEEPPKHAIFILATTEKHKIIPTILSRCQIFDFSRIQIDDIASHLGKIAQNEQVQAEADGLHIIAQKADGALRDALSMFDQIVSFSGGDVSYKAVIENLNILDYDYYFKITDCILSKNISDALLIFNEILNHGFNGHHFVNGLAEHFRNLLVCLDAKTVSLLEVGANIKERYVSQAAAANVATLIQFLEITNATDTKYKSSQNQRLLVEVMLMQLCASGSAAGEKKNTIINLPFRNAHQTATPVKEKPKVAQPIAQEPAKPTVPSEPVSTPEVKEPIATQVPADVTPAPEVNPENTPAETPVTNKTTAEQPAPKPSLKTTGAFAFAGSISIHGSTEKEKEEGKAATESTGKLATPYTVDAFIKEWNSFKEQLLLDGKSSLASAFDKIPSIENDIIYLMVENKVLHDEFKAHQAEFLEHIRLSLKNHNIQVTIEVNKDVASKKAYTPQEKFIKMSEKNPDLKELVRKLDMDVGYA
ncbi:MAG: DNA polymerase III subunit gamma/tau [Flavobacteriales bacterium]|nr:DNA polymerase III subunit gamma/tau [Flavobacteriales bacterium]